MSNRPVLLLVDAQEDFLARPGLTPDRATLVATLAAMLDHARASGWPVIHVHTLVAADLSNAMPHRRAPGKAEVVAGTKGAETPPELAPVAGEPVLTKRFFSAFDAPGLDEVLRSLAPSPLIVAGVHTHACIRDTVTDAYARGFDVVVPAGATASDQSAHAAAALRWIDGRAADVVPLAPFIGGRAAQSSWDHLDPCDQGHVLASVRLTPSAEVAERIGALEQAQRSIAALSRGERRARLADWRDRLAANRSTLVDSMIRDVAKPRRDCDGEVDYGLALIDQVLARLDRLDELDDGRVAYRPRGVVGLITPWNNPFAIAVAKLAPALAYGNAVAWKPALPATGMARLIAGHLEAAGLGRWVETLPGDSGTGDAIVADERVAALSFTGSVPVGQALMARTSLRRRPPLVQAELGGSNAAIVDSSADLDHAALDLAAAIFSFSGQRCTAIRRIILLDDIADVFVERLIGAVASLRIGNPGKDDCDVGPLIDRSAQRRFIDAFDRAERDGGSVLVGGGVPASVDPAGCWVEPTIIAGLQIDHPLNQEEWFGPLATILRATDIEHAIALHNQTRFGLIGALYSTEPRRIEQFEQEARAGMLSINRARPAFAADGPFVGWGVSAHGMPEHGRWNRDFYATVQARYRN